MEIKDIIKSLLQQCNIESISTKNLTNELGDLYNSVDNLELKLKQAQDCNKRKCDELDSYLKLMVIYQRDYVTPKDELDKKMRDLEREKFKFEVEREYQKREVVIYKELVASLTAKRSSYENYSSYDGSNGASSNRSYGLNIEKPNFPQNSPDFKIGEV